MTFKTVFTTLIFSLIFSLPVFSQKLVFDSSFAPTIDGSVNFIEVLGDGKILIAGAFSSVNGVTRNRIARLNPDGTLDETFNANSAIVPAENPVIYSMEILPGGKILLGGDLGAEQPQGYRKTVLRLNADGTSDVTLTSFPRILSGFGIRVEKAEQLPNGKIFICGIFQTANGNQQPRLARYNFDGSYDSTFTNVVFTETAGHFCRDVEARADGKYFVSGAYTTVNGSPRFGLTRFNADDTVDTTFDHGTTSYFGGLELLSDGTMIVAEYPGGGFLPRGAHLNSGGSLIRFFHYTENSSSDYLRDVKDVAFQANGKAYITDGGRANFYRYNTDGTTDVSQNRVTVFGGSGSGIKAVAVLPDGKVLAGGNWDYFVPDLGNDDTQINQKFLARFTPQAIPARHRYDFDGDGKDDLAVFRPSDRTWYLYQSTNGFFAGQFGIATDIPVSKDYDGDGRADIAVFRDGVWYWLRSSDGVFAYKVIGQAGDIPIPRDLNGNDIYDFVFRPSTAKFYIRPPFQNEIEVSFPNLTMLSTDKPVFGDYNGDGRDDMAIFRDGHWYVHDPFSPNIIHYQFGLPGDKPAVGDYDGDGRSDYAVYRPSDGTWYLKMTTDGFYAARWGIEEDIPVPADYDGDGKTDIAVWRPSNGVWYKVLSSTGSYQIDPFGLTGDIPIPLR